MEKPKEDQLRNLYELMRNSPVTTEELFRQVGERLANFRSVDVSEVEITAADIAAVRRVTGGLTESEFLVFAKGGDLPPVKLRPAEMERIKGGHVGRILGIPEMVIALLGNREDDRK